MGPFSHAILATRFIDRFRPPDPADYLWGAVAPDVRYLAKMPRARTHLPLETVDCWAADYPDLKSFILGYRVHLLLDQIDVAKVIGRAFPFNLIMRFRRFPGQQMTVLAELHFIRANRGNQPIPPFSGAHNPILGGLGISAETCDVLTDGLRQYFADPRFESAMDAFNRIGMVDNARMERYTRAAESLQKRKALTNLLLWGVQTAHLEKAAEKMIQGA